jgi:crossover junction endodeoxyribonuclease RusA
MTRPVTAVIDPVWTRTEEAMFSVLGAPQSKGSARAFVKPGMRYPIITSTNPKVKKWEQTIRTTARVAMAGQRFVGPVVLKLTFRLRRPLRLKAGESVCHQTYPDLDKLIRAVLDGLTGACYDDDRQVVSIQASKWYANSAPGPFSDPGVTIRVGPLPGPGGPSLRHLYD